MIEDSLTKQAPLPPKSDEFTRTLGQVTWLLTLSPAHRDRLIRDIEANIIAPLMLKQVRVYLRGKQPIAAVVWAYASPDVKAKVDGQDTTITLQDWRSGPEIIVVDCISPFHDASRFKEAFLKEAALAKSETSRSEETQ